MFQAARHADMRRHGLLPRVQDRLSRLDESPGLDEPLDGERGRAVEHDAEAIREVVTDVRLRARVER